MSLIRDIDPDDIVEIWKLVCILVNYKNYIVLLSDVIMNTKMAKFHIGLIARRWYKDDQQDKEIDDSQ
ncbi:37932_t:CDS:2 [Gigaspora margarita]|uniref:37932_t:CDS:1 n=1 Tax=Gigaspora margarita TaxID=4874 RepID=A0ABN7VRJ8_GIGMA|nr:37932_t:CDS:2 [Gigaspora margarita]